MKKTTEKRIKKNYSEIGNQLKDYGENAALESYSWIGEDLLREELIRIYNNSGEYKDQYNIYKTLVKLDDREETDVSIEDDNREEKDVGNFVTFRDTSSGYWHVFKAFRKDSDSHYIGGPNLTKGYISFSTLEINDIFNDSIDYLTKHCNETFGCKATLYKRTDQICYYMDNSDFYHLIDFYMPYHDKLKSSTIFIPSYNGIGISKDFSSSYNGAVAELIKDYFKTIENTENISANGLFDSIINKTYNDRWCYLGLDLFIAFFESMDTLFNNKDIDKNSIFFKDKSFWKPLSRASTWEELLSSKEE